MYIRGLHGGNVSGYGGKFSNMSNRTYNWTNKEDRIEVLYKLLSKLNGDGKLFLKDLNYGWKVQYSYELPERITPPDAFCPEVAIDKLTAKAVSLICVIFKWMSTEDVAELNEMLEPYGIKFLKPVHTMSYVDPATGNEVSYK